MDYPKSVPGVGLVNGKFIDENPVTGAPGSLIPADWGNAVTDELLGLIQAAGIEPSEMSHEQVLAALRALFLRVDTPSSQRPRLAGPDAAAANDFEGAALEIRENGLVASADTDAARSPRIAFHWASVFVRTLAMSALGQLMWGGKRVALIDDIQASTDGLAGSAAALKISASGKSADVIVSADAICVKDSERRQKVLNGVLVSVSGTFFGAGGLDSGALAASSWYSVWVIHNPTSQAVMGLISLSVNDPVLPEGYTYKARVGWIRTDGTANKYPLAFQQKGRKFEYMPEAGTNISNYPQVAGGANSGVFQSVSLAGTVPPGAASARIIGGLKGGVAGSLYVAARNIGIGDTDACAIGIESTGNGYASSSFADVVLQAQNVFYYSTAAYGFLSVVGWEDNL